MASLPAGSEDKKLTTADPALWAARLEELQVRGVRAASVRADADLRPVRQCTLHNQAQLSSWTLPPVVTDLAAWAVKRRVHAQAVGSTPPLTRHVQTL